MKVLLFGRDDQLAMPGGDTIQINAIDSYLHSLGHDTFLATTDFPNEQNFDLAILFNLTRPEDLLYRCAWVRSRRIPFLLFPVYWDIDSLPGWGGKSFRNYVKTRHPCLLSWSRWVRFAIRHISNGHFNKQIFRSVNTPKAINRLLCDASLVCPNSNAEVEHLKNKFNIYDESVNFQVVLNGIVPPDCEPTETGIAEDLSPYISCVGGIGPRKNQLNLVRAAVLSHVPVVIVGKPHPRDYAYFEEVKKYEGEYVKILGHVPHSAIRSVFMTVKGNIQPSFIETPGLASLEALSLGCPIGVSNVAPVREYFQDRAIYCDPNSVDSIGSCLRELANTSRMCPAELVEFTRRYDWNNVLRPLGEFVQILNNSN